MTIEVQGHVEKMEQGQPTGNTVRLTIYVEGDRSSERIVIDSNPSELANQYLPGTSVTDHDSAPR